MSGRLFSPIPLGEMMIIGKEQKLLNMNNNLPLLYYLDARIL